MARPSGTILTQKAFARQAQAPMVDLRQGAQMGVSVDLPTYISNTPYVRRDLIAILLEVPRGFQHLDNGDIYTATLKTLVELHAQSITGLNSQLDAQYEEAAFGGAGEMQETISDMKRQRSTPTFTWVEKYGKPISRFLRKWMLELIMDPNTKFAGVAANAANRRPTDMLADYNSMSVLFIEPDPTGTMVQEAWLCTNMQPKSSGEISGSRDITQPLDKKELSIEFTAITQVGEGVNALAQRVLSSFNLGGMNPNQHRPYTTSISADVAAAGRGYAEQLREFDQTSTRAPA